jgi:Reverse transcriptase (RNA-dependent DNA polymerase)
VCLLHKSPTLVHLGFKGSSYDPSLFLHHTNGDIVIILIYVDDLVVTSNNPTLVQSVIDKLKAQFSIRDLGNLHYFLGIEMSANQYGLVLSQTKYLLDLLARVTISTYKPCLTPMVTGVHLTQHGSSLCTDPSLYRSVVGVLQYATLTRPDLAFPVNNVSQFMHQPTEDNWSAIKRILRYVAGTLHMGLQAHNKSNLQINAYTDADWAGNLDDRRFTSGFYVYLGSNLISRCSKKQPTVSPSSTEAEYRSLALTGTEILWLQYLLAEIYLSTQPIPILWCDNIGATFLASNPMFHAHTKHIKIDYHFVREKVASN